MKEGFLLLNKQIDVKRALALARAFTFMCSCARGCVLPFLTLYFRQLGLPPAMTGVVMGTKHLITLVWRPMASLLSKHYNKRRVVITGSLVCSAAVAIVLLLIQPADMHMQTSTCNMSGAPAQNLVVGNPGEPNITRNKMFKLDSGSGEKTTEEEKHKEYSLDFLSNLKAMDSQHQLFFLILITMSLWECASAPLEWTADDGLYEYLDYADASDGYSSSGVWALLGAACGVGGAGLLVSQLSCFIAGETPRSALHFYCYAAVATLALPVAAYLPLYLNKKQDRANGLLKAVQLVRGSPRALLCAITTLLVGVVGSAVDDFLLWQMQDHGSSELHMGLSQALALLSQAAFPLLAGRVSGLLSPGRVLAVGATSIGLQCFYYSFLWGPWAALPAQVLSCFGNGAILWAVKVQCEDVAMPGAERNMMRVYIALSLHLGSGLGSFVGGLVVQRFGLTWLFRGAAVGLILWCVCLPLLQWNAPRQHRINYSRLLAADASETSDSESEQERDWLNKAMEDDKSNNNYGRRFKPLNGTG
uniref:Major facilitator superfamily associated domain-containing protein n=1 Tax=Mola mola TaxID=94237 RepID=A0A3Q3W7G1_MOLML